MKTTQRRLYNHLLFAPIGEKQKELATLVRNNKLGSYKCKNPTLTEEE